jgi:8-oxo-dGTP pyrophosphatase MutT (NUDIX family)
MPSIHELLKSAFSVAKVLVFNEKGEVLILYRAAWLSGDPPAYYREHAADLPGGAVGDVEINEDERSAAAREVTEETGITVAPHDLKLIYADTTYGYSNERNSRVGLCYLLKLEHTPDIVISREHEKFAWRNASEISAQHELHGTWDAALRYVLAHHDIFKI